ncbi:hypothetical protein EYF80_020067 [Liparis tanakae]|uniref:Uncharacterized protein n=1 Tax=Liparis tanakae TaxID=230148 RepID=A0A4Z2HXK6_9TELE|nr:hypothetical protein EYF80_020067 [Liparis tanakae]
MFPPSVCPSVCPPHGDTCLQSAAAHLLLAGRPVLVSVQPYMRQIGRAAVPVRHGRVPVHRHAGQHTGSVEACPPAGASISRRADRTHSLHHRHKTGSTNAPRLALRWVAAVFHHRAQAD